MASVYQAGADRSRDWSMNLERQQQAEILVAQADRCTQIAFQREPLRTEFEMVLQTIIEGADWRTSASYWIAYPPWMRSLKTDERVARAWGAGKTKEKALAQAASKLEEIRAAAREEMS
jgi:hypothetical protein